MIGSYDLIVAATALERGSHVATFNKRHFALVKGLHIILPHSPGAIALRSRRRQGVEIAGAAKHLGVTRVALSRILNGSAGFRQPWR